MTTSSGFPANSRVVFQFWRENDFRADEYVQALSPIGKWMYRTLLQSAFVCSERPYLPDDDARLWVLAGCESRKQWDRHKVPVLALFTPITIDGQKLLSQKKLVEDWERVISKRVAQSEGGRKGGLANQLKENQASKQVSEVRDGKLSSSLPQAKLNLDARLDTGSADVSGECAPPSHPNSGGILLPPTFGTSLPLALQVNTNGAGRENQATSEVEMFKALQIAYTEVLDENGEDDIPTELSPISRAKLHKEWLADGCSLAELCGALRIWMEERYIPSFGSFDGERLPNPIAVPCALFAESFYVYLPKVRQAADSAKVAP